MVRPSRPSRRFQIDRAMKRTTLIKGAYLISTTEHADHRGRLSLLEYPSGLPFVAKRIFTLTECPADTVRAEHSNPADQVITVPNGAVHVELDNGHETMDYRLEKSGNALWIRAGVWLRLRRFEPQTVVLILSPIEYNASAQFDAPQPDKIVEPE